jgi:hypothetical protein
MHNEEAMLACDSNDIDRERAYRHFQESREEAGRVTTRFEQMWELLEEQDVTQSMDDTMENADDDLMLDVQHLLPPVGLHASGNLDDGLGTSVRPRDLKLFTKQLATIDSPSEETLSIVCREEVQVATLNQIMNQISRTIPTHDVEERWNPTVNDVSRLFSLNERQHMAFTIFAVPLLHKFLGIEFTAWNASPLYVTGAGGVGKSRVVEAIQHLAKKWGRQNAIRIMAPTGVAAALLGGTTLHSAMTLPINAMTLPPQVVSPPGDILEQWQGVCGVILDELSMIGMYVVCIDKHGN